MSVKWITGDVFDGLAQLDDASVDLVVTSPPFLALRSYLPTDHPDKEKEIGSETTPAEFIDTMLRVVAELRRVLAPHGSICIEIGDTYAGSGGAGGDYSENGLRAGQPKYRQVAPVTGWPLAKSKALIPQLLEVALAYGINPLTGAESPAGRWRIRNVVTWCRPNPPVGALGDKWRPATSDVIVACVSEKRYWDDLATRRPSDYHRESLYTNKKIPPGQRPSQHTVNGGGAPLLDYWVIPPGGYKGSHYAVMSDDLVVPLVQAMLPPKVCRTCGEPQRRTWTDIDKADAIWTCCGCGPNCVVYDFPEPHGICYDDHWRPPVILDPFAGSGTTLAVALGHNADALAIGIDLDERNEELARDRVGPLLWAVTG